MSGCPLTLAHRGFPGYYLEHTLEGYEAAVLVGADFIELDIVMTADQQMIVVHDMYLDDEYDTSVFNYKKSNLYDIPALDGDPLFFERKVFTHDLTYDEIVSSTMCKSYDRFQERYPGREVDIEFRNTCHKPLLLSDALEFLNDLYHKQPTFGIVVEMKRPRFYQGFFELPYMRRLSDQLRDLLMPGFNGEVIVQCFEPEFLREYHKSEVEHKLMQLAVDMDTVNNLPYKDEYPDLGPIHPYTRKEAEDIAVPIHEDDFDVYIDYLIALTHVEDGPQGLVFFSPWKKDLMDEQGKASERGKRLVEACAKRNISVIPYTFRADVSQIPRYFNNDAKAEMKSYYEIGCVGVFTDFANVGEEASVEYCSI